MNPTSIEVIATALGGTYTARGDAVAVVEDLKAAGFAIVATRDKLRQAVRVAIDYALSHGSPATYLSSEQLDSATEVVIKIIGAQHG